MQRPKDDKSSSNDKGYEDLFNFSIDLLCINGLDGYFRLVNPAFEKLLGYTRNEFISRHFINFVHPDDRASTLAEMEKRKKGKHTTRFENRYMRKDGSSVWIEWNSFPVLEKGVMYAIGHDITERKKAEEVRLQLIQEQAARDEAEKGIRLRDEFISIASHELKTPLVGLKLQLQIIPKILKEINLPEKEKFLSIFQKSLRQLDQFVRLVDDLLDVSLIRSERLVLERKDVLLSSVVTETVEQYQSELKSAGCVVSTKLDNTILGKWDLTRISQIVVNLLTNAIKYGAGKPIEITTQIEDDDKAKLTVRDYGIGIAKEDKAKIFERFARAVSVTKYGGLGLGLFITRQIVHAHGGTIRVESELGQGSTFIVELPLRVSGF